jgi:2-haloacid dehalogenase
MQAPSAVLFDAYGTLFDVYSVTATGERLFPGQGAALAALWRDKQIEYTRLITMSGDDARYLPFWDITTAALRYAGLRLGLDLSSDAERALLDEYRRLRAFPEVRSTLDALRERGIVTGILSNGDPTMLDAAVRSAGLEGLFHHVLSVDAVRKFKTSPEAYALGTRATGLPAQDVLFVSSNGWDALGAAWWGYRTLWINRQRLPFETLAGEPERIGHSLADVLDFFPSR